MPRVNPGGWVTGDPLTATQANNLDIAQSDNAAAIVVTDATVATNAEAVIAQFTPSASALADGSALTLTAYLGYPSGEWTLASNEVEVPSVGVYRATLNLAVEVASATNPLAANIYLMSGAAGVLAWIVGNRFNATAADSFRVSGSAIFAITNTATQKIWLRNESSANITTSSAGGDEEMLHSFIIERIGDAA
jgi:hypothetical protein